MRLAPKCCARRKVFHQRALHPIAYLTMSHQSVSLQIVSPMERPTSKQHVRQRGIPTRLATRRASHPAERLTQ